MTRVKDSNIEKLGELYTKEAGLEKWLKFYNTKKLLVKNSKLPNRKKKLKNISIKIWTLKVELESLLKKINDFGDY